MHAHTAAAGTSQAARQEGEEGAVAAADRETTGESKSSAPSLLPPPSLSVFPYYKLTVSQGHSFPKVGKGGKASIAKQEQVKRKQQAASSTTTPSTAGGKTGAQGGDKRDQSGEARDAKKHKPENPSTVAAAR